MKFLNIWILHWFVSLHNLLKEFSSLEEIFWSILKSSSRILSFEGYFLYLKIIKNIQVFTRDKDPQDSSRKCSAWKDFRFKPLSFQFPPRDRVKCDGLGWERVLFLSLREVNIPNLNPLLFLKKFLVSYGGFAVF